MSDIMLFRTTGDTAEELRGSSVAREKHIQMLVERNLETFLGVRFLATEYITDKEYGGRIDTLGIDENDCPAIIEYKKERDQNVVNQGLYYLNWLVTHKAEFKELVERKLSAVDSNTIEWTSPRLICIAGDFTKFDKPAVQQMKSDVTLIRYRLYGDHLLLLESVHPVNGQRARRNLVVPQRGIASHPVTVGAANLGIPIETEVSSLFESLKTFLFALGDDVQMKELKNFIAFMRIKRFASVILQPKGVYLTCNVDPRSIALERGFTRNDKGKTGISIKNLDDLERAKPLLRQSFDASLHDGASPL